MAASLEELLRAYRDAGHRVSTGYGESPESVARRQQSLAIAQLKDAQIAADEALRSGNYKAYLKSRAAQNDSLIKHMVDMQKNAGNNRAKVDAAKIKRLTDIDKSLDAQISSDVFDSLKRLKQNNGLGDPQSTLEDSLMKESLVKELKAFGDDPRGLNETRALLRAVGREHNPPLSVEEVEGRLENREAPDSWIVRRLSQAKDAESRIQSDLNSFRVERAEILRDLRRGYAGGGWVRRNFGEAGDPAAAMMQNPQGLQVAYEAEVPEGSRSKEFEIAERERQLGGTMLQTLEDVLSNEEFKTWSNQLGLQTPGERRQFARAMVRGPRAANRFMDRYLGEGRNYGEGRAGRGDGIATVGRRRGAGYAEGDDVLFDSVEEREAADKEHLDKIKAAGEEALFGPGGARDIDQLASGWARVVENFGGTGNIPAEWIERTRREFAEQRHIRQQEGGDAAEIERLSGMMDWFEGLEEYNKTGLSPQRSIEQKRAGEEGPIDLSGVNLSAQASKILNDLRSDEIVKDRAEYLRSLSDRDRTAQTSKDKGVLASMFEEKESVTPQGEEISAQEEVVEEPAPSAEAAAPKALATKEQYEAAGLKAPRPRRFKKILKQLREGR